MLEWRPRFVALLALVFVAAVVLGYEIPIVNNWEW